MNIININLPFLLRLSLSAPCAPQDVAIDAQCDNGALAVSWSPNPDVQYFHVAAVSSTGGRLHCNSSGTACTMRDLPCGQHYNVTALSVARSGCESTPSAVVETSTGMLQAHLHLFKYNTSTRGRIHLVDLALQPNEMGSLELTLGVHIGLSYFKTLFEKGHL